MIQAIILGFIFGIVSNLAAMFLRNKIVQSSEDIISKPKQILIHLVFFILFLAIFMCLSYITVAHYNEIRYILIKFLYCFTVRSDFYI